LETWWEADGSRITAPEAVHPSFFLPQLPSPHIPCHSHWHFRSTGRVSGTGSAPLGKLHISKVGIALANTVIHDFTPAHGRGVGTT